MNLTLQEDLEKEGLDEQARMEGKQMRRDEFNAPGGSGEGGLG